MQHVRSFRLAGLLTAAVLLVLPGCKLEIRVPEGGKVVSSDGAYVCESGQTCLIDVVDLFFDETFIAQPAPGYYFSRWNKRERYLCGGETTPCRLFTADFEGNPALQSLLESDETFVIEPRFVFQIGCPDPELITSPGPGPLP
ncbi:MAG: hypothetical protein H6987_08745 [Pseudomonadales bacterium]|nr:hypothetical protein [Halioglobus sp.]MCP5193138.1 hypothetical protein [Pseudomonadales bacterium]